MNKVILKKPLDLKENPTAEEVGEWLEKESKHQIQTFLEDKEYSGEDVSCTGILNIQERIIKGLMDKGLVVGG